MIFKLKETMVAHPSLWKLIKQLFWDSMKGWQNLPAAVHTTLEGASPATSSFPNSAASSAQGRFFGSWWQWNSSDLWAILAAFWTALRGLWASMTAYLDSWKMIKSSKNIQWQWNKMKQQHNSYIFHIVPQYLYRSASVHIVSRQHLQYVASHLCTLATKMAEYLVNIWHTWIIIPVGILSNSMNLERYCYFIT